jgi:hypothetical protein
MSAIKTEWRLSIGRRFDPATKPRDGVVVRRYGDKLLRRRLRRNAIAHASKVERALKRCREDDLEVAQLATNSHQRKRAIAADRTERNERTR